MTTPFLEIEAVLRTYLDALYFCDTAALRRVFHAQAIYATADETPFLYRTLDAYVAVVAERQSPASRNEPRRDFIDSIEIAGANTARARVRCSIGARSFVDFLTLVRVGERWQILSKVFQIIESSAPTPR